MACLLPLSLMGQTIADTVSAPVVLHSKKYLKQQEKARKQLEKNEKKAERERQKELQDIPTEKDVVYLFGVGVNFNDTTLYLTDIQAVPYMKLTKKYKFLPFRSTFSLQFEQYLEGTLGLSHETCSVFYDVKRKRLAKHFYKLKKRYLDGGRTDIIVVEEAKFKFQKPLENVANE